MGRKRKNLLKDKEVSDAFRYPDFVSDEVHEILYLETERKYKDLHNLGYEFDCFKKTQIEHEPCASYFVREWTHPQIKSQFSNWQRDPEPIDPNIDAGIFNNTRWIVPNILDLSGFFFKFNFTRINRVQNGCNVIYKDPIDASIETEYISSFKGSCFVKAKFDCCRFANFDFSHCTFSDAIFNKCSFKNCTFDNSILDGVFFENTRMTNCSMKKADLRKSTISNTCWFQSTNIDGSNFLDANFDLIYLFGQLSGKPIFR